MEKYYRQIKKNTLFENIDDLHLRRLLACLNARICQFSKNQSIIKADSEINEVCLIVEGTAYISRVDLNGDRVIIKELKSGESYGESIIFSELKTCPLSVTAATQTTIIFLSVKRIFEACNTKCNLHGTLSINLIKGLARENTYLNIVKGDILAKKTIRNRITAYLMHESRLNNYASSFAISFNREDLADFLCVNQSAMSRELSKMQEDNLINYKKNYFKLKDSFFEQTS